MIILDTHVWVWWVNESPALTNAMRKTIERHQKDGIGVSMISCWEVAKLVELGRLQLVTPVERWLEQALAYPGVELIDLTLPIVVQSTQLPDGFHRDPADQLIVATSRVYGAPLLTADEKIRDYPHVKLAG